MFPIEIQFRNFPPSEALSSNIQAHAEKLRTFYDRIISCHVIVSAPHRRHLQGKLYHVQIRLHIPKGDIFITTEPEKNHAHEDAYVAVRDAFGAV